MRNALNFRAHSTPMHNFAHLLTRIGKSLLNWKASGLGSLDKGIIDINLQLQNFELGDMVNSHSNSDFADY